MAIGLLATVTITIAVAIGLASQLTSRTPVGEREQRAKTMQPVDLRIPFISPVPQRLKPRPDGFRVPESVHIVTEPDVDTSALQELMAVFQEAGVNRITRGSRSARAESPGGLTVWLGKMVSPDARRILMELNVEAPQSVPAEGYVLVAGHRQGSRKTLILAGADEHGTFYAVQTLRQLLVHRADAVWIPGVEILDWPRMQLRGVIEGFYGPPWSHDARLRQLLFMGRHKLNTYVYAPKDDPFHKERWRDPYPSEKLGQLAELLRVARQQHVRVVFAFSPGNSICHARETDFQALLKKAEQVWEIGIRDYALLWDDIKPVLRCAEDRRRFGDAPDPLAAAQAHVVNRFQREFLDPRSGVGRLITIPTEYWQKGPTPYRRHFARAVDPRVIVYWTGIGVVAPTVTASDADRIFNIFRHDLLLWDNYPVNDFQRDRLFLGPLVGRDPDLADHGVIGITANPMNEAEASQIALATVADFAWNPQAYDPQASWEHALRQFGGKAYEPLRILAGNSRSSRLDRRESPELSALIKDFWAAYESGRLRRVEPRTDAGRDSTRAEGLMDVSAVPRPAQRLLAAFRAMRDAPARLRQDLDNPYFLQEADAYLQKLELYGRAGEVAVRMLLAATAGDWTAAGAYQQELEALQKQLSAIPQQVAPGVMDPFLERALREVQRGRPGNQAPDESRR